MFSARRRECARVDLEADLREQWRNGDHAHGHVRTTDLTERSSDRPSRAIDSTEGLDTTTSTLPTVLLVHGAFTDGSSWRDVVAELQTDGIPVLALANPLRGLSADAAYVAHVTGLVCVAAFIPELGESLATTNARFPGSDEGPVLETSYPGSDGGAPQVEPSVWVTWDATRASGSAAMRTSGFHHPTVVAAAALTRC